MLPATVLTEANFNCNYKCIIILCMMQCVCDVHYV